VLRGAASRRKNAVLLLYFLPLLIPQMTYGIPLATSLYRYRIGGTIGGGHPRQPRADAAAGDLRAAAVRRADQREPRMGGNACTAPTPRQVFRRVVLPLAVPGLLTAGLLVLVNTVANFELTFLLSGAGSQTLVVALYYAVFAAGMRPIYSVDAMAVIYMAIVLAILVAALRFVRPTQMVFPASAGNRRTPWISSRRDFLASGTIVAGASLSGASAAAPVMLAQPDRRRVASILPTRRSSTTSSSPTPTVLDPSQRLRGKRDIGIKNGQIAALSSTPIAADRSAQRYDAAGRLATPGLVDLHTHYGPLIGGHRPARRRAGAITANTTTGVSAGDAGANNLAPSSTG